MKGIIIKNENGYFSILGKTDKLELCRSRGNLKMKTNLLVGDIVEYDLEIGSNPVITKIYPRKNTLQRPPVANIDQLVLVVAIKNPDINLILLDRMIAIAENNNSIPIICINKFDLSHDYAKKIENLYKKIGYASILISKFVPESIENLKYNLSDKINAFTGPSGAGKSTILNQLIGKDYFKSQEVSAYTGRGKTTTRHVELVKLNSETYIIDTPGFTCLDTTSLIDAKIDTLFKEFNNYIGLCKFSDCKHLSEPKCAVLDALENNLISKLRYNSYKKILLEIEENKRRLYK